MDRSRRDHLGRMEGPQPQVGRVRHNLDQDGPSQTDDMKRLLRLLKRLTGKAQKPPLHTPEELECFKRDAIENRGKHY
ncbi:hypothetical protein OAL32_00580 [Synechococcus sp. AH-551-G15]|nr:hypothetical protein [Synechococcus sp. AH-551-G15]